MTPIGAEFSAGDVGTNEFVCLCELRYAVGEILQNRGVIRSARTASGHLLASFSRKAAHFRFLTCAIIDNLIKEYLE